jgi:hypothetical protein
MDAFGAMIFAAWRRLRVQDRNDGIMPVPRWMCNAGSSQLPDQCSHDSDGDVGHETKARAAHDLARKPPDDQPNEQNDE